MKQEILGGFSDLSDYFQEVEQFNLQITEADISFEAGRIKTYQGDLTTVLYEAKKTLRQGAFAAIGLDILQKGIELTLTLIDVIVPALFGGGGSAQDAFDATTDLLVALSNEKRAQHVKDSFKVLKSKSQTIADGLKSNSDFLETVEDIVNSNLQGEKFQEAKSDFLLKYGEYNPAVGKSEITALGATWETLLDEACNLIENTDSLLSIDEQTKGSKLCVDARPIVAEMVELYSEIFEFQFQLVDSLAFSMKSQNAIEAAKDMQREFNEISKLNPDADSTLITLAIVGGLSYVNYRSTILQAVTLYCNFLEYKDNFIETRQICRGPDTDISALVNFKPRPCTSEVHEFYHDVPIKHSSTSGDEGFMDIEKLYSGRPVYFKIPNTQWLTNRTWIFNHEREYALYVKQFEIYLPTKSGRNRKVHIRALPLVNEKLPNTTIEYIIEPQASLSYSYTEGPSAGVNCRVADRVIHPYMTCKETDSNTICHDTISVSRDVHPSIYARWKITLNGYEDVAPPDPANEDFSLKIGMKLCKLTNTPSAFATHWNPSSSLQEATSDGCCEDGMYKSGSYSGGDGICKTCPVNSTATLAGYYCERN